MGLFNQCFAHLGNHNREEEPLKFKIERRPIPGVLDHDYRWPVPDLVGIQPLTHIGEARFDLIERSQELARRREEKS